MARKINCKINVSKLDKNKLFKGKDGFIADITLIETPNGKYGNNWMIVEDLKKEERGTDKKGTILGNGKNHGWGDAPEDGGPVGTKVNTPPDDLPY
jgi:hypothetical protein